MNKPFKLLIEQNENLDTIIEENIDNSQEKNYFVSGIYLLANEKNRNNRFYKLDEMIEEVKNYHTEFITKSAALGELNHPESSVDVNLERACHLCLSLVQKENFFYGKSKILSTPCGNIVKSLIKDKVRLGMSSRALGRLVEKNDYNLVENLKLICMDIVWQPSVSQSNLQSVLENKQYLINSSGKIMEVAFNNLENNLSKLPKHDINKFLEESFKKFINNLK